MSLFFGCLQNASKGTRTVGISLANVFFPAFLSNFSRQPALKYLDKTWIYESISDVRWIKYYLKYVEQSMAHAKGLCSED